LTEKNADSTKGRALLTVDVEDWFNILDTPSAPPITEWSQLECRFDRGLNKILEIAEAHGAKATFFWLGWFAERHPDLVRLCDSLGHETASHGYGHVLPYKIGRQAFRDDLLHAKAVLEDIIGVPIKGFRSPGFGVLRGTGWCFDEIITAGFEYDSSIFPMARAHGGVEDALLSPHLIETSVGRLVEIPQSAFTAWGTRFSVFGGGYLRLAPLRLIKYGVDQCKKGGRPVVLYVHPRELDPSHPRLDLPPWRRFKSYVNLDTVETKPQLATSILFLHKNGRVCKKRRGQRRRHAGGLLQLKALSTATKTTS
jgi:polysaccharide deacetylase family protein (PEP-CTERM system associated)